VTEVAVPESDDAAVRVMTIHGSKGLEFPIVILTGLNYSPSLRVGNVLISDGNVGVRVGKSGSYFETPGFDTLQADEKLKEAAEDVRLMYVATTRARDHLVVSMYRQTKDKSSRAAAIAGYMGDSPQLWQPVPLATDIPLIKDKARSIPISDGTKESRDRWIQERQKLLERVSRPAAVAATTLAQIAKEDAAKPEEPWRRGRAGTSIGRAVHAVLQTVDLVSGEGLADIARAQAAAEGLPEREKEIADLVQSALKSDTVRRAVESGRLWREVPVGAPFGDLVIEGFIDLLFEEKDGLVLVDYKTDSVGTIEQIEARAGQYRVQMGGYAYSLMQATGKPVKEAVLVFLKPQREYRFTDIIQLIEEAKSSAQTTAVSE